MEFLEGFLTFKNQFLTLTKIWDLMGHKYIF